MSLSSLIIFSIALSSCATKRHGRVTPLSSYEKSTYNCKEVKRELSKVESFEKQVADKSEFNAMSVAAFLGDFGIGNVIEKNAAIKSAAQRKSELLELKKTTCR